MFPSPCSTRETWSRFTSRTNNRADKIKRSKPLVVINEKRSLFRLALVKGYGAEKLGRTEEKARRTGVGEARGDDISVEIVCFSSAGESLINSGLVLYLTDSKNVKRGRREEQGKEEREGGMASPTRSRTCCISERTGSQGG